MAVLVNDVWHHYDGLWERGIPEVRDCKNAWGSRPPQVASSPLTACTSHLCKDFALESGLYALICCE